MTKAFRALIAIVGLLSAGALAGCNSAGTAVSHSSNQKVSAFRKLGISDVSTSLLDYYFPATGPQFNAGVTFTNFETAASSELTSRCLVAEGFPPLKYTPDPYLGDNSEFPNLAYIKTHGFVGQVISASDNDPTAGMSASEISAYRVASKKCGTKADSLFQPIFRSAGILQSEWMSIVSQIDETSQVQTALAKWDACMGSKGVHVTTIDSFFDVLGAAVQNPNVPESQNQSVSLHYAKLFVSCFGSVEDLRDHMRIKARTKFFNSHAEQISGLRALTESIISDLEKLGIAQ